MAAWSAAKTAVGSATQRAATKAEMMDARMAGGKAEQWEAMRAARTERMRAAKSAGGSDDRWAARTAVRMGDAMAALMASRKVVASVGMWAGGKAALLAG